MFDRSMWKFHKIKIYKTIILPVVQYDFEIWYLSLKEEHRLRVLEKRILRRIFRSKRDAMWCGKGFTMRNFIGCIVYLIYSGRRLRWAGLVARVECFQNFNSTPTGKRPSWRPRRRSEEHIRMDIKEIGINRSIWVDSDQDWDFWRVLVNAALYHRAPWSMDLVSKLLIRGHPLIRSHEFQDFFTPLPPP